MEESTEQSRIDIRARVHGADGWIRLTVDAALTLTTGGVFQPDTLPRGETVPLAPFERTEGEAMRELAFVRRELDDAKIPDRLGDVALLTRERVHMLAKIAATGNDAVQALQAVQAKVAEAESLRGELAANRMALDTLRALVGDAAGILVEAREHLKLRGQIGDRAIAWIKEWSILGGGS